MTLLYYDPCFLEHDTGAHVEQPLRLIRTIQELAGRGLIDRCERPVWAPATGEQLKRLHSPSYIDRVRSFAEGGGGHLDADTVVSQRSFEVARMAAGAAVGAVERVLQGPPSPRFVGEGRGEGYSDNRALCLVRPPGHHALSDSAMGFCLFGNVAVAAATAIEEFGVDRVLIVDWDVHHGNGTQDFFYSSERVGFLSIHRWPFWPGTGAADETGAGAGLGYTANLPTRFGTPRADFRARFQSAAERLADKLRPQLVLVSAGFDAHVHDPIGSLGLETEDFVALTQTMLEVAKTHSQGRLVSVLEGGYEPADLANNVASHLEALLEQAP